ncbi:hypothetical protein D8M23_09335 [Rothia sp. HSID18067]|nr:hypothetical protein ES20_08900 [Rothia aeria]KGJ31540.1 hypothetical protein ES18_11475 [Rothia aeria]OXT11089.1 hypothetical protein B9K03_07780 [Rothia sp. Olga]RUP71580.1 hypothetical protein D8M23_09335 [Rothia sp. HSID18067]TEA44020.1 hypothetical protein C0Z14_02765 [Rothia aeria]
MHPSGCAAAERFTAHAHRGCTECYINFGTDRTQGQTFSAVAGHHIANSARNTRGTAGKQGTAHTDAHGHSTNARIMYRGKKE